MIELERSNELKRLKKRFSGVLMTRFQPFHSFPEKDMGVPHTHLFPKFSLIPKSHFLVLESTR